MIINIFSKFNHGLVGAKKSAFIRKKFLRGLGNMSFPGQEANVVTLARRPWLPGREEHGYLGQKDMGIWVRRTWLPSPEGHGYLCLKDMVTWARRTWLPGRKGHSYQDQKDIVTWARRIWLPRSEGHVYLGQKDMVTRAPKT